MEKVREGYKMTELGEIPEGWGVESVGENAQVLKSGLSRNLKDEDVGIPCIRSNNIVDFKINSYDLKYWYLEDDKGANIHEYTLDEGDILVNFINSIAQIGKCCIYHDIGREVIYTTNIFRMKLNESKIKHKFFYYIVQTKLYSKQIELITKPAVNQASFTTVDFKKIKIPVPSIDEQKQIISILSSIDDQIEITGNLIEKTKELKKGLMQRLLTKGIGHEKFKDTEIGRIPEEWGTKKFKDISKVSQGLQIAIEERFKEPGLNKLPYITIQYINDKKNYDNKYYIENANASVICVKDDILMTRTGNTGVVVTNEHGVFHNNFFKIDYDKSILDKDFLVYYLKSKVIQSLILRYAGTTTIPDLKHKDFYKIPVIIPTIIEQKQIASILSSIDDQISQYESKKEKLQKLKKGLMQKLLTGKIRV